MELYIHSPNMPSWRAAHLEHKGQIYLGLISDKRQVTNIKIKSGYLKRVVKQQI
jgi:hypothetical protein